MARGWQRVTVMKKTETEQILEYLRRIDESINGPRPRARPSRKEPPLSKRVDKLDRKVGDLDRKVDGLERKVGDLDGEIAKLDNRVSEVQQGLATLAASTNSQFKTVARNIAGLRVELVDHMERIHGELTGRIAGLERSGPEGRGGGGRGSGGCGVPLAS